MRSGLGTDGVPKIAEAARAARREQIIAAGLACFARSGYHAATMADVAVQAGVSKGTPHLYFDSKEALFLALHEEWDCGAGQRVNTAHVTAEPATCRVLMEARALAAHEPAVTAAVRAADARAHGQLEALIAAGVRAGEWPDGTDAALAARLFTAGLYGLMAQWHLAPGSFSWDHAAAALAANPAAVALPLRPDQDRPPAVPDAPGAPDEPGHGPEPVGCRAEGLTGPARQVTRRYWPSSPGRTRSPSAPAVRSARPCCSGGIYEFPAIEADVKRATVWCPPARSPCWQDSGMERVLGIGGYFMRAADPAALSAWYRDCLGLDADENGLWRQGAGLTVFATFESGTGYFGSRAQQTMLNFRVRDLDAMLGQLRDAGADVAEQTQDMEGVGRFGWVTDPEGNRVELWQPA